MNASLRCWGLICGFAALALVPQAVTAEDAAPPTTIEIAQGEYSLPVPEGWTKIKPRYNLIEHEFEVAPIDDEEIAGRVTISNAGGSIDDNINRWLGQFSQPDGSSTADVAKISKIEVNGTPVQMVDVSGTYDDKISPFSPMPGVKRDNYRMLAAVITTKESGNYYLKFYGPARTVGGSVENFNKMVQGLQAK